MKKPRCSPNEAALKAFFVAPQAENRDILEKGLAMALRHWIQWRKRMFSRDGTSVTPEEKKSLPYRQAVARTLREIHRVSRAFHGELPRHSPRYIGHMLSEYSIPAFMGHFLALLYNPNNVATEASRVGVKLEKEAVGAMLRMVGYGPGAQGHFTSGGSIANFEMLFRAREWSRKPAVLLVPESAHYSWKKGAHLVGLAGVVPISLDADGRLSVDHLAATLRDLAARGTAVMGVVSVLGTTELGVLDPVDRVADLLDAWKRETGADIWHHVDAAWGGFFACLQEEPALPALAAPLRALRRAHSLTIDPHKLGYVPYSSGCFLCCSEERYRVVTTNAPYIDFDHLGDPGPFTLEGSRTAAGPIATLLTSRVIGFHRRGLGRVIHRTIRQTRSLRAELEKNPHLLPLPVEGNNILCFALRGPEGTLSSTSAQTRRLADWIHREAAKHPDRSFHVSQTTLGPGHRGLLEKFCQLYGLGNDSDSLHLIRCTVMNPFFQTRHLKVDLTRAFGEFLERGRRGLV
ncbi:MAG: hypothetical protein HUU37_05680 [Bdellovibrionales bacterium]|nr:hypothetical protein [Bdellovibrionales bacterium]